MIFSLEKSPPKFKIIQSVFSVSPCSMVGPKEHGFTEKADWNGQQNHVLSLPPDVFMYLKNGAVTAP